MYSIWNSRLWLITFVKLNTRLSDWKQYLSCIKYISVVLNTPVHTLNHKFVLHKCQNHPAAGVPQTFYQKNRLQVARCCSCSPDPAALNWITAGLRNLTTCIAKHLRLSLKGVAGSMATKTWPETDLCLPHSIQRQPQDRQQNIRVGDNNTRLPADASALWCRFQHWKKKETK